MTPEELFEEYRDRAERIAQSLCWHYQVSGALNHQEEAKSEALLALWRACQAFDPEKQALENKKRAAESNVLTAIFGVHIKTKKAKNPYANFWMWAITRVRGRVIDYFRSERLITRIQQGEDKDKKVTMLYQDRFLSASYPLPGLDKDPSRSGNISFLDLIPSKDRTDSQDDTNDNRAKIDAIMRSSDLTEYESMVVTMFYGNREQDKKEIAASLNKPTAWVSACLAAAIAKMKVAATQNSIPKNG